MMDPILLARIQFAANISFHILFPVITIALGWVLLFFKLRFNASAEARWMDAYRFWVKVFALSFALGVVSGITMSFQFGTNWPGYMNTVGNIAGPLLAYEVLTAFFLEATFVAIMLFGMSRVPDWLHTLATALVAVGTSMSAFWILALNSWMQTPQGFAVAEDGVMVATSFAEVIFNPSLPSRFAHMVLAAYLTTAMAVAGASAFALLKNRALPESRTAIRMAILMMAVVAPLQVLVGHESGVVAHEHQPAKIAAMEGWWTTRAQQPTLLFAWPDQQAERNYAEIGVPGMGSWFVAGDADAELQGLDAFAAEDRPPVWITFWSFRIMVAMGLIMVALGLWGALWWLLKRLDGARWYQRFLVLAAPSGFIAVLAGWIAAEVGRQPYVVYGVLRTADAVSPVGAASVAASLLFFIVVYAVVFTAGAFYILRLIGEGPDTVEPEPTSVEPPGTPLGVGGEPRPLAGEAR